ncbi:MAG: hypothetical protein ACOYXY_17705 [Thermodesulfobacteriota bacterium]
MTDIDSLKPEETCFVISPVGEPTSDTRTRSDRVLKHIVVPAAKDNGLVALRSDSISAPGIITSQIIRHILNDKMVVADLTDHNANVFYELALRHAFRKPLVQLISSDQRIPFDVQGTRVVKYSLDLDGASDARSSVARQIRTALAPDVEVESPVTIAAQIEELTRTTLPENQLIMKTLSDQIDNMNKTLSDMSKLVCRPEDLRETIPPLIKDQLEDILRRYAEEIELLKSVRFAGVNGIFKRREMAIKAFARAIDEESTAIWIVGSSLKGLLQKDEYTSIAEKLRFKTDRGLVQVRFLLTHPIVADFRASQENRGFTEIGVEIISTLEKLREWNRDYCSVKLYLGTPTCFAIKTTHQMLINPYPYISVSYDSPCFIVEYSSEAGAGRPCYFYDEFKSRHFGAWDTDLSIEVKDFDRTINQCRSMLSDYASNVETLLSRGKTFL